MYTFKKNKKNCLDIFNKKSCIFKIIIIWGLILIIFSLFCAKYNSESLIYGINIDKYYVNRGILWSEPLLEQYIPLFTVIIMCAIFYKDYTGNAYEMLIFYNENKLNIFVFLRWFIYTNTIVIISFVALIIQYMNVIESILDVLTLLIRFIPPILFMSSLCLFIIVFFKNIIPAFVICIIYTTLDKFTNGRLFKIFTLLGDSFFLINKNLFYINRLVLIFISIIFVYLACRISTKM